MYKIGIDLGGTKVEGIVLDQDNKELFRKRYPNGKEGGYQNVLDTIKTLYTDLCNYIDGAEHTLGLGTPGAMAKESNLLKNSNIECMNGEPFQEDLEKLFNHKIIVENDANCFALAEAVIGAGKGKDLVFGVIMGTGCGGGIVYKGEVIRGLRESAGEWGHSTINFENGPSWRNSPLKGLVEAYISGTGAQERYEEEFGEKLGMQEIVESYRDGEERAVKAMNTFLEHYGISISNIIKFMDPDAIVLGGGLSNVDEIYSKGPKYIEKYCLSQEFYTPVLKNEYGDSAGVFGAALIGVA
ncbi:MAG: ROK family protein [Cytophagales bacterium]|nr:ROK family protein [Cytophagales bacterium]